MKNRVSGSHKLEQADPVYTDEAECRSLSQQLRHLAPALESFLKFEQGDALAAASTWKQELGGRLPDSGIGVDKLVAQMATHLVPNGSGIVKPGCSSWITTGAASAGVLAQLCSSVASPQRFGLTAFNYLEELSLDWMAELFGLPVSMQGIYSSGGSVANLVALGAARQAAFESLGIDAARDGVNRPCVVLASEATHNTINRAAAVLGMGRSSVQAVMTDKLGRMCINALRDALRSADDSGKLIVAIVATAGTTSTGAIDPLYEVADLAREFGVWLHVDGAYGLPGVLDQRVASLYQGLELADSVVVDPHKWMGAPVGIGATFVRDAALLKRAFTQEAADYFEHSFNPNSPLSSMDNAGIPYSDYGVELSAPARGAVVWALLREIGRAGLTRRICRHNSMARRVAEHAIREDALELLVPPTLSVCCFRYVGEGLSGRVDDLNELNRLIHRRLVLNGINMPSTTMVGNILALRPCFIGARSELKHADELVREVLAVGQQLTKERDCVKTL